MTRTNMSVRNWRRASLPEVCQRIGAVAMQAETNALRSSDAGATDVRLGTITLRPHQIDAVQRLRLSIHARGGALLADSVGLGKTYVALAVARAYADVHILAPATLVPMWRTAMAAAHAHHATVQSLHKFSRRQCDEVSSLAPAEQRALVMVDEAHYLRTRATVRYGNVARFCANRDVLLISATPLHNKPRELRNLLALFLGERADALDAEVLAGCVVRRSGTSVSLRLPEVETHAPLSLPENPAVLECILTVATPLPPQDGGTASALVRLGLLRAWCSSDAALTEAIRRRQLRGEALLHSLSHGRYPTQRELQSWIVGTDSVQLGFPDLLVQTASTECAELLKTLLAHLDSLQVLLEHHTRSARADAVRLAYLRQLLRDAPNTTPLHVRNTQNAAPSSRPPMVAFSQFASTVRALHRALGDIAGIASLTSHGGRIASGKISRDDLIAQFAPRAHGRPPPPAREHIQLLITTDLLAEGVNLQDADTVIHLDLPWTDALQKQRVGRLVRMGSEQAVVHVHTFAPPMGTEQALRITAALERKAGLHREFIGEDTRPAWVLNPARSSAADEATQLREMLQTWATLSPRIASQSATGCDTEWSESQHAAMPIAIAPGYFTGFVAAVAAGTRVSVVASTLENPATAASDGHTILQAVRAVNQRRLAPTQLRDFHFSDQLLESRLAGALVQLHEWNDERTVRAIGGESSRALAPLQQRALQQLAAGVASIPATTRRAIRAAFSHAERQILNTRGAGAATALRAWLEIATTLPLAEWLANIPVVSAARTQLQPDARQPGAPPLRIIALVLLATVADTNPLAQPLE